MPKNDRLRHASRHSRLEQMTQQITVAETAVPVLRKRRMIRHRIRKVEAAEPAVGKVEMNFFTKATLRSDTQTVPHHQHPDQELGINRRAASMAVEFCKVRANTGQ